MENLELSAHLAPQVTTSPPATSMSPRWWQDLLPILRLTTSERRVILAVMDVLVLNLALLTILALRGDVSFSWKAFVDRPIYAVLLAILWGMWSAFFDCYDLPRTADASQSLWSAGKASFLTALCYLAIPIYTPHLPASRLSSFLFIASVTASVPVWRAVYAIVFTQPIFQQRLLVVGTDGSGVEIARALAHTPQHGNPYAGSGYRMIGFVDDDPGAINTQIEGMPVLGSHHDLLKLAQEHKIDLLVVAANNPVEVHPELFQALLDCRERGVCVEPVTSLYERLTGKVLVEYAGCDLRTVMPASDSPTHHIFCAGKRLLDLLAGFCGLMVLSMVTPFVALVNAIWSPGPVFYRQTRVGKGGKPFVLYKFRSMIPAAEQDSGAVWAREDDDRITPVGRLLRKTRLDELPQCWNILRGEMSLIGPRPERPEFVAELVKKVPFYRARHAVRPGITGWAQVRYRYGSCVEDALIKLQHDLFYIKRQSFYLELSILVKTATVIIGLKGR